MSFGLASCQPPETPDTDKDPGTTDQGGKEENKDPENVIASLTATESSTEMKVGDTILLTNFYEIKGTSSLSAAQRACTYESSNPEIVKINAKRAEAVAPVPQRSRSHPMRTIPKPAPSRLPFPRYLSTESFLRSPLRMTSPTSGIPSPAQAPSEPARVSQTSTT